MLNTPHQADQKLKQRLEAARKNTIKTGSIPEQLKPVVRSCIRKGESKKKICILFGLDYDQLKQELKQEVSL